MSNKRDEFNDALKEALRARDQIAMSTIRLILAAIKDRDIAARTQEGKSGGISDQEILSMLQSMVKQRQESIETYRKAGRDDLADREEEEIRVIEQFLPKQMDAQEMDRTLDDLIAELGVQDIKEMGRVMAELKKRYAGKVDMGQASARVKAKLAA